MSTTTHTHSATQPAASGTGPFAHISGTFARVRAALTARRQRRSLLALDDRMLADIGISRSQAYGEASRSLFDINERTR